MKASGHCGAGSGSCCDRAKEDASARRCCQGGDTLERPRLPHQPTVMALAATADLPAMAPAAGASATVLSSHRAPPRLEPLYTLHSSLLI